MTIEPATAWPFLVSNGSALHSTGEQNRAADDPTIRSPCPEPTVSLWCDCPIPVMTAVVQISSGRLPAGFCAMVAILLRVIKQSSDKARFGYFDRSLGQLQDAVDGDTIEPEAIIEHLRGLLDIALAAL